jgi:catechol 2,3-dioxygenase-like lactoylglutathione lyase family enzyme
MFDHIGFAVSDYPRALAFYKTTFEPLGIGLAMEVPPEVTGGESYAGFGREGRPQFWIGTGKPLSGRLHVAFEARSRAEVDAFYAAAIAAGGADNGKPGLRPIYHQNYYAAFVIDPDGHNVEAVCHAS